MQALLADLFPWVAGFTALDGLAQLLRGHLVLVRTWRRFGLLRAGIHLLPPWPAAEAIALQDLPFLAGSGRLLVPDPRRRTDLAVYEDGDLGAAALDGLGVAAREGTRVVAGPLLLAVSPTAAWAERLREDLAALAAAPAADRARVRDGQVAGRAAVDEVLALRARQRPYRLGLAALGAVAFALVFVAWPLAAWAPRWFPVPAGPLLGAIGVLLVAEAAVAFAMLVACGERVRAAAAGAAHLVLVPVSGLHPLLHAGRSLYRRFEPWAVAAALLAPADAAVLMRRELRRVGFSRAAGPPDVAAEWDRRERVLEALLARLEWKAPAAAAGTGAHAVCPLCGAEHVEGPERCGDCGVPLDRFPPPP